MLSKSTLINRSLIATLLMSASPAFPNVTGSELQNFNPAPSTQDGATVSSARTLGENRFSLGLFGHVAANSLPYFREEGEKNRDRRKKINDTVSTVDAQLAYGILESWDISLSLPFVVDQSIADKDDFHGEFKRQGVTELRFGTKVQLLKAESLQLALLGTANYNTTINNPYVGDVRWPGASLELALSTQAGILDWSLNVGHRWRMSKADTELRENLPIDPSGDQWLASTGVAIDLPSTDVDLLAEVYTAYREDVISEVSSRKGSIAEASLGFRKPLPYDLQFHAGLGSELSHSQSSADYRAYVGVRWALGGKPRTREKAIELQPTATVVPVSAPSSVLDRTADVTLEIEDVYFKFNSTEFREPRFKASVSQLANALAAHPIDRVIIEGYACSIGSEAYNFDLSDQRAEAIERMLISEYHVSPEKLVTVGWGEMQPKFDNREESTRKNNRRVTFKIFYQKMIEPTQPASLVTTEPLAVPTELPKAAIPPPSPGPEGQNVAH
jgi:outer membrane protein OmpA-like peptidoglycan-associated protein